MDSSQKQYRKHHSFDGFFTRIGASCETQHQRCLDALSGLDGDAARTVHEKTILHRAQEALSQPDSGFRITQFIADELSQLDDCQLPRYLFHRYRYDVFPKTRELDSFPPCLQIEPSSQCNFRCVFCYQADKSFSAPKHGFMGQMSMDLFKAVIDEAEGNIDFCSLASRGEPLLHKKIDSMVDYCRAKFLGMKMNTNASMLDERQAHALLSGGINTLVFSVDAAKEPDYSNRRVGGSLERVVKNIKEFERIRQRDYPRLKLITRVSGVHFSPDDQDLEEMVKFWGDCVDQVAFVRYNPWENLYQAPINDIALPCSDLWRRMFVWHDGVVNPCDTDYQSKLQVGTIPREGISELWRGDHYEALRTNHLESNRPNLHPCNRCSVL